MIFNGMGYKYDPDADVLAIEISKEPFDYAEEVGDFVVHFTKRGKPVYVEILNAHRFIRDATKIVSSVRQPSA